MALSQSWPGVSGKAQALDIRRDVAGIVVRPGLLPSLSDPGTPLLNKTSTMIPTVREFHAAIKRTASDGSQLIHNDGPTGTFPQFTAAPQTGSRMDILWVKAFDTAYDPRANVEFGITDGVATTGTAVANRAAMPAGALELGTLLLPAGATTLQSANVVWTDTAQFGALRGSRIPFRNATLMTDADAATHPQGTEGYIVGSMDRYRVRAGKWVLEDDAVLRVTNTPNAAGQTLPVPANARILQKVFFARIGTNASGVGFVTFPDGGFPTACLGVWATTYQGSAQAPVINGASIDKTSAALIWTSTPNGVIDVMVLATGY